jgi:hypothetical protein
MRSRCNRGNRFAARMVIGFGLMVLGAIFILRNLAAYPPATLVFFWPLILVLLALASFIRRGPLAFGGHVLLLGALAIQLKDLGHMDLLAKWWPLALIWLGSIKVAHSLSHRKPISCQDAGERLA